MITDVPGIRVGHATDEKNHTGCTVVLCPPNTVASSDNRGPAPGSREAALLAPDKPIQHVHAVLLTGGSAFGLGAAEGVVRYLEENGIGHLTPFARVPLVPAAVVYDLFLGDSRARPTAQMGYEACEKSSDGEITQGNVGAGVGVTVGKWAGFQAMMKGGVGTASYTESIPTQPPLVVGALAVVNSLGDVVDADGQVLAGGRAADGSWMVERDRFRRFPPSPPKELNPVMNTTLVVIATNAKLSKVEANRLAQRAHDGMAIAIRPVHTSHDGDTAFALATGQVDAPYDAVANIAVEMVTDAIRSSVRHAKTVGSILGLAGD